MAQLGVPDMKAAIAYALSFPQRIDTGLNQPDFISLGRLTFEQPDLEKFPCLALAFEAMRAGGGEPATLNAANEIAVETFLDGRLPFRQIPVLVDRVVQSASISAVRSLEDVLAHDAQARRLAETFANELARDI